MNSKYNLKSIKHYISLLIYCRSPFHSYILDTSSTLVESIFEKNEIEEIVKANGNPLNNPLPENIKNILLKLNRKVNDAYIHIITFY